jgi:CheY-like chemotaxis protein
MPSGGTLTIETAAVDLDDSPAREQDDRSSGPHVMLAISDTGHGMDRQTLEHIFEPFFTTKSRDRGSGLGLSTVYGIVKQHGGSIQVDSSPGRGSTFRIYLPREAAGASLRDSIPAEFDAPGGEETLLVVEDDEAVRQTICRLLQSLGYRVLSAGSGPEAIARAAGHGGPIDLLVSDVIMPQMNGRQVYDELAAARPGLRVLFISGYTDDVIVEHGVLEPGLDYLPKPFTVSQLAIKVREVIDR